MTTEQTTCFDCAGQGKESNKDYMRWGDKDFMANCRTCGGTGKTKQPKPCPECNNRGVVTVDMGGPDVDILCNSCNKAPM